MRYLTSPYAYACVACDKKVCGGFEVTKYEKRPGGLLMITAVATKDLDHVVCARCYRSVHFRCSKHPDSGFCDGCYDKAISAALKLNVEVEK